MSYRHHSRTRLIMAANSYLFNIFYGMPRHLAINDADKIYPGFARLLNHSDNARAQTLIKKQPFF